MKKRVWLIAGAVVLILAILLGIIFAGGVFDRKPPAQEGESQQASSQPTEPPKVDLFDLNVNGILDIVESKDFTKDTDCDGLPDYQELARTYSDPAEADTDGDDINDFDEDLDGDGFSNGYELSIGTSPSAADTDSDGLSDSEEVNTYGTDPLKGDTDEDGAGDGWEVARETDPLHHDDHFEVAVEAAGEGVTAKVEVRAEGTAAQTVSLTQVKRSSLINETIPGYMGSAFELEAQGELGIAKISFTFNQPRSNTTQLMPTVYCLNEETQQLFPLDTTLEGNTATARSALESTYILLDKTQFEEYQTHRLQLEPPADTQTDSNHDGIPDYLTKWMCDGVIRTGTGALIFEGYTYEQVQSGDDVDGDGLKNGEEITVDHVIGVAEDAVQWVNGHYYKRFDEGHNWFDVYMYCKSMGGYPVTITSGDEQDFVRSLLQDGEKRCYWLGASDDVAEGDWYWVTGEPWEYTNWYWNQPNNDQYGEHYAEIQTWTGYNWNDGEKEGDSGDYSQDNHGFVCEWDAADLEKKTVIFLKSSPVSADTDRDGFTDNLDCTPNKPDVFATMTDYKKYYYEDDIIVTFCAKQPVWDSRQCYSVTGEPAWVPYYVDGASGHCYLGIDDENEEMYYFGFFGHSKEAVLGQLSIALFREEVTGDVAGELYRDEEGTFGHYTAGRPIFSVGKSFVITQEQKDRILAYKNEHCDDTYRIAAYNCTTFGVNALKEAGINFEVYEHYWTHTEETIEYYMGEQYCKDIEYGGLSGLTELYYGYSPADVAQDIKENYDTYVVCVSYQQMDGTMTNGYQVMGRGVE